MASVRPDVETSRPSGYDTLSLRHPTKPTSVSQPAIENEQPSVSRVFTATGFCTHWQQPKTWSKTNKKKKKNETCILMQREDEQRGRALWCQGSLIKFLRGRGWACGWRRNARMVFALCPPQATVPPEALYISVTLLSVTLWLWSCPQPAPTSDPRSKGPLLCF